MIVCRPTITGAALHVWQLAKRLDKATFQVIVTSPDDGWLSERLGHENGIHHSLRLVREIRPAYDLLAAIRLWRLILQEKPHILHLHSSKAGFLGRILRPFYRVPVVVYTPHGLVFRHVEGWKRTFYLQLERLAARFEDRLICVSESERESAIRNRLGFPEQVTVIHNGVELAPNPTRGKGTLRRALQVGEACSIIAMLARLERPKQPEDLVRAAARLADTVESNAFRIVFIGDGPLEMRTRRMARALGVEHSVVFMGYRADVPELIADVDVTVLASKMEGMPYTLLESMAAGKPVVGSNVPGVTDLIQPGVNGFCYQAGDPDELSRILGVLLEDEALRRRLGAKGRQIIAEQYSAERMVQATEKMYLGLLHSTSNRSDQASSLP